MGIWYDYPQCIHLEPTRACNARCPQCMRTFFNTPETMPNLKITEIDPLWLDEKFKTDSLFKKVDNILINGNLGDIVMHSNPKALIQTLLDNGVKVIRINTNGGALSQDFWAWLGSQNKVFTAPYDFPMIIVNFAIDGLEDTHHLYRRNTRYDVVIRNLKTFIQAGGIANAQINVNGNNKHQMDELYARLKEMGVNQNIVRYNQRFVSDFIRIYDKNYREEYKLYSAEKLGTEQIENNPKSWFKQKKKEFQKEFEIKDFYKSEKVLRLKKKWAKEDTRKYNIQCYVNGDIKLENSPTSFYLSADGRVWTCCWMENDYNGYVLSNSYSSLIDTYYYEISKDPFFNSLHHHTGEEIISLDCFVKLRERWRSNKCLYPCVSACGSAENISRRESEIVKLKE